MIQDAKLIDISDGYDSIQFTLRRKDNKPFLEPDTEVLFSIRRFHLLFENRKMSFKMLLVRNFYSSNRLDVTVHDFSMAILMSEIVVFTLKVERVEIVEEKRLSSN
jgi:hypothetical protein